MGWNHVSGDGTAEIKGTALVVCDAGILDGDTYDVEVPEFLVFVEAEPATGFTLPVFDADCAAGLVDSAST